ncbi:tRNA threonylcarbamoyl adenosine modification protein YeaZ [Pseudonocardia ammonioxydans]|uniref:tRNA threonylcarbamoyl adenosine modification protein YeaZ n=1 Tax=Pseudonocardia ammonioxydans TaxID=260086 RepID=A0A1I5CXJ4_PSUAM|nr:tRNA (adenosine(37)-N6)-threonylcarbamoyltransferase complex dimerization subunit type 1 TsaB [Pseudonocardia ammonioxydans]SFN91694.1 tRNA threonylcarbamoyl adenosine modification protein YeaZ [Pseudonocardia ammonioxydans]
MLVLALDTATPVVTAGLVELPGSGPAVPLATRAHDGRKHGELLVPAVRALCAEAGRPLPSVEAIVVGVGPGPFTGLRVGIATAAALGHALDVPVHGVCSHDAIATAWSASGTRMDAAGSARGTRMDAVWSASGTSMDTAGSARGTHVDAAGSADGTRPGTGNLLVVTDARRREVYWAAYDPAARRLTGPAVEAPAALAERLPELAIGTVVGDPAFAGPLGTAVTGPATPAPEALVEVAAGALRAGRAPAPVEPLYLRRPDAVEPTGRKRVTA